MKIVAPLDPECPSVEHFRTAMENDPMTEYSGVGDELAEAWSGLHRQGCDRCQEYGAANIAVE